MKFKKFKVVTEFGEQATEQEIYNVRQHFERAIEQERVIIGKVSDNDVDIFEDGEERIYTDGKDYYEVLAVFDFGECGFPIVGQIYRKVNKKGA